METTTETCDDGWTVQETPRLRTTVTVEHPKSIVTHNRSPDVPFEQSINPYRGCEHGCVYCYARPTHAYLGLSPGQDFESRLYAKPDAHKLLAAELARPGYRCRPIALGTNTDPYQPVERRWQITRQVIEVLHHADHPLMITTKSSLIERDLDLLAPMAARGLVRVYLSIATLNRGLAATLEPRAPTPSRRLLTLSRLAAAGVPSGVMFAPAIPALNDPELEEILEQAAVSGVKHAGYVLLRLPAEVKELFLEWLNHHRPNAAARVMALVRETRRGRENDSRFGVRMRGQGQYAELLRRRFEVACRRLGLNRSHAPLVTDLFHRPEEGSRESPPTQLSIF